MRSISKRNRACMPVRGDEGTSIVSEKPKATRDARRAASQPDLTPTNSSACSQPVRVICVEAQQFQIPKISSASQKTTDSSPTA